MNIVELLKEKRQQFQLSNGEFIKRFEPQVRELKETWNQSVSNSFANTFFSRLITVANEEIHPEVSPTPQVLEIQAELQGFLGKEIHVGDWYKVDQGMIAAFADVTGDTQWIHVDTEKARKESPYKSTVAHGFLLLALLPKLRGLEGFAERHYPSARMVVNCGMNEVRFLAPVKPGNYIRSRTILRKIETNRRSLDLVEEILIEMRDSGRQACRVELVTRIFV